MHKEYRLAKVAGELNRSFTLLAEFLKKKGFDVEARPTQKITEEMYQLCRREFSAHKKHSLFDKHENEILDLIKEQSELNDDLIVLGKFNNFRGKNYFINIRNKDFVPLTYVGQGNEHIGKKIKIEFPENQSFNLKNDWYEFKIKLSPESLRRKLNNPTLLSLDLSFEPKIFKPNEMDFVLNLYRRKSDQSLESDRGNIQSLKIIEREINRVKEAFIYELLQNADDYPVFNKKVDIHILTTSKEFIFSHTGSPFKFNNVYALCNINDGDKQDDNNKIGYKGIGFKSVFAYSEKVIIKSGNYQFQFDKNHPDFQREKPYQIIPIWINQVNKINQLQISENVNIIIEAKQGYKQIEEWKVLLNDIFSIESTTPVTLFLRNIKNVYINKNIVSKTTREWWIRGFKLNLPENIQFEIKRQFENNTGNIPEKLVGVDEIEIQFSLNHDNFDISLISEALIYNYLPTKVNLGFPFLINSDFIPTGDRHYLFENEWNKYLMKEVGLVFFDWLNTLFIVRHGNTDQDIFKKDYLKLIPEITKNIQELKSKSSNNLFLLESFKEGFDLALIGNSERNPVPFIPSQEGNLEPLSNILIDETGIVNFLGSEFFELTNIKSKLISNEIGAGIKNIKELISEYNNTGKIYGIDDLKIDIKTKFQDWLKKPANNSKFVEFLQSNDSLKSLLKSEEIILSNNGELSKSSDLFAEIPEEITFLLPKQLNHEVLNFINGKAIKLEFKKFEPLQFFKDYIIGKTESINDNFINEKNLLLFWQFVFNNWIEIESEKEITNCLKNIEILCKSEFPNPFSKFIISKSYLSREFNLTYEIESTVRNIIQDAHFISEKYIAKNGDEIKWRKIFNNLDAVGDLQKAIVDLLPNLSNIDEQQHYIITKQIFKYWRDNKDKETRLNKDQIELIKKSLKLKCIDNVYRVTSDCIISDHYQTNKIIDMILDEVNLTNQISSDYNNTQISDWNTFFKEISCISLEDKQQVLNAKISFLVTYQDKLEKEHLNYINGIYNLYNSRNTNGLEFDFVNILSRLKLKTITDEFIIPSNIHLSSIYKPKLDLQNYTDTNQEIYFLSLDYSSFKISSKFFVKMGVFEDFKFLPTVDYIKIDDFKHKNYLHIFLSMKNYRDRYDNIKKRYNYSLQQFNNITSIRNHININYDFVFKKPDLLSFFWDYIVHDREALKKLITQTQLRIWDDNIFPNDNYVLYQIKNNETVLSNGIYRRPTELFSRKLKKYLELHEYPDNDFSAVYFDENQSINLEEIIGVNQELSVERIINLLSIDSIQLSEQDITDLKIVEIIKKNNFDTDKIKHIKLPNMLFQWKSIEELFISQTNEIAINPEIHIHEYFIEIAKDFGIKEISKDSLQLKIIPEYPSIIDEIKSFYQNKAKFITYKVDQTKWPDLESDIIQHLSSFKFYEVELVSMVYPKDEPIYEQKLDFYCDAQNNEIFYTGPWKYNKNILEFLHREIKSEKITKVWFENVVNRWDDAEIIKSLLGDFGFIPEHWNNDNNVEDIELKYSDPFWSNLNESDINFIREIIGGDYELNEQMDANLAAKIKTLIEIRYDYLENEIIDNEYYLKAGSDEIIVRSAQRGLLFLDLFHWNKLDDENTKLAIHTNNEIIIFQTQQDLFDFTKSKNKYGIMKLPINYSLEDLNSIGKASDNGKWHFVFIVNENAKVAKKYKEVMNLDDYNF
jgi:hypothetical protein